MDAHTITAPPALTIRNVTPFAEQLGAGLAEPQGVRLDLSPVEEADLGAVQLILAARAQAEAAGRPFALAAPAHGIVATLLARAGFLADPTPADIDFWFHGARPQ